MSQNRSSAVMEQRAPGEVVADDPRTALMRKLNFFPTPPWAARAGAELVLALDPAARAVLEPAAGMGHMSEPLAEYFPKVTASDIHDYGVGLPMRDFLGGYEWDADWVITNPPFNLAADFVREGLCVARRGVAVLCRTAWLESADRYPLIWSGHRPMTVFAPFIERVAMQLGSWDPELSAATSYSWFVFQKGARPMAPRPIPPGTKRRLTHQSDVRRFAREMPAPLFDAPPGAA